VVVTNVIRLEVLRQAGLHKPALRRHLSVEPVPTENSIRVESVESSRLCEIIVLSTLNPRLVALFALLASRFRTRTSLQTEVLALRHQLAVLEVSPPRRLRFKALDKDTPEPRAVEPADRGRVLAIPQVGGLHHRY
jgi:hypothetical protein